MSMHRGYRGLILLLIVAMLAVVPIGASAQTEGDVDRAEDQVERAQDATSAAYGKWKASQDELEEALLELDKVTSQLDNLIYTIGLLESKISSYEGDVEGLKATAQELVLEAYTSGGRGLVTAAFEAGSIQDLLTSQQLMDRAASRDIADLDRLQAVSREMDRLKLELVDNKAEVEVLEAKAAELVARQAALSEEAKDTYNNASAAEQRAIDNLAKERRELQAAIALKKARDVAAANAKSGTAAGLPPAATPGFYCPVQGGASFIDSWGFPRSGGRRHKGVDMFNARNTPSSRPASRSPRTASEASRRTCMRVEPRTTTRTSRGIRPTSLQDRTSRQGPSSATSGTAEMPATRRRIFTSRSGRTTLRSIRTRPCATTVPDAKHIRGAAHVERRRRRIDLISDPAYVQDLGSIPMDQLRERRAVLDDLDTEFSFYRRMLHGRMDLLSFEMRRRSGEETRSIIEALPQILADGIDGPSRNTIPRDLPLTLPELGGQGNRAIDRVLGDDFLARLPSLEDDELEEIQTALTEAEREVSNQRRAVYDVHDKINAEITRRYREGLVDATDLFDEQ